MIGIYIGQGSMATV